MERLGAAGFDRVELVVTVGNRPAEALYTGLGFRVVEGCGD
jgi:ribosomal protein S18 acetylase RimI-like enzyme